MLPRHTCLEIRYRPAPDIVSVHVVDIEPGCMERNTRRVTHQPDPDMAIDWQTRTDGRLIFRAAVVVNASRRLDDPHLDCLGPVERLALRHAVSQGADHLDTADPRRLLHEQVHRVMSLPALHSTVVDEVTGEVTQGDTT